MDKERAAVKTLPRPGPQTGRGAPASLQDAFVLGRYRLLEALGSGGHGSVWIARDENTRRLVAVKRIPFATADPQERVRVEREGRAAARLSHPAIVALFSIGDDRDAHYLVSELVEGASLARLYERRGVTDRDLAAIGVSLATALEHAHARGVVHRDVKPGNVIVPTRRPGDGLQAAKLTDFGVASVTGEQPLTRTGDVIGTLAYMAPEQAEGRAAGPAADLYSLALTLYEGFAGENPLRGDTVAATARRIGSPIPPLAVLRPDLPAAMCAVIDRALDPAAANRGTLSQLQAALAAAGASGALPARAGAPPRRGPAATDPRAPDSPGAQTALLSAVDVAADTVVASGTVAADTRRDARGARPSGRSPHDAATIRDPVAPPASAARAPAPATHDASTAFPTLVQPAAAVAPTVVDAIAPLGHAVAPPVDAVAPLARALAPAEETVAMPRLEDPATATDGVIARDPAPPAQEGLAWRGSAARGAARAAGPAWSPRVGRLAGALATGVLCGTVITVVHGSHSATVAAGVGAGAALLVVAFAGLGWLLLALGAIAWLGVIGQPGTALIVAAGVAPIPLLLGLRPWLWSLPALAPALGAIGLGGCAPALAGRIGGGPVSRAALGALSYWWLALTETIVNRRLLLGTPTGVRPRADWQGSLTAAFHHVLTPLVSDGRLATAALWALAALVLPWLVRGPLRPARALSAAAWAALLTIASVLLASHVGAHRPPLPVAVWALCAAVACAAPAARRRRDESAAG